MKHIVNKYKNGTLLFKKDSLADITELTRISPTATRILFLLANYCDKNNSIITDPKTLSKLIGLNRKQVESSLRKLFREQFIDITRIYIEHSQDIFKYLHDYQVYHLSRKDIWRVIDTELVGSYNIKGYFNRFIINPIIIKCQNTDENNLLLHCSGNAFYDIEIPNEEMLWED